MRASYSRPFSLASLAILLTVVFSPSARSECIKTNDGSPYKTAVGCHALNSNKGVNNTAAGYQALTTNTTGTDSTAIGEDALNLNLTGNRNTGTGESTLFDNKAGEANVANGYYALNHAAGNYNVAVGARSGCGLKSGDNNIYVNSFGEASDTNTIRIGTVASHTVDCPDSAPFSLHEKTFIAGIGNATVTDAQVFIDRKTGQLGVQTSASRFKTDIRPVGAASDKLFDLRPVSFRYKQADGSAEHPLQYGLLAEDVAKVLPELVDYDETGAAFAIRYHLLTPLLLAEIQNEHAANERLRDEIAVLRGETAARAMQLAAIEKRLTDLASAMRRGDAGDTPR